MHIIPEQGGWTERVEISAPLRGALHCGGVFLLCTQVMGASSGPHPACSWSTEDTLSFGPLHGTSSPSPPTASLMLLLIQLCLQWKPIIPLSMPCFPFFSFLPFLKFSLSLELSLFSAYLTSLEFFTIFKNVLNWSATSHKVSNFKVSNPLPIRCVHNAVYLCGSDTSI